MTRNSLEKGLTKWKRTLFLSNMLLNFHQRCKLVAVACSTHCTLSFIEETAPENHLESSFLCLKFEVCKNFSKSCNYSRYLAHFCGLNCIYMNFWTATWNPQQWLQERLSLIFPLTCHQGSNEACLFRDSSVVSTMYRGKLSSRLPVFIRGQAFVRSLRHPFVQESSLCGALKKCVMFVRCITSHTHAVAVCSSSSNNETQKQQE